MPLHKSEHDQDHSCSNLISRFRQYKIGTMGHGPTVKRERGRQLSVFFWTETSGDVENFETSEDKDGDNSAFGLAYPKLPFDFLALQQLPFEGFQ